jgi:uncharacterized repeat protein (TIGR01451 family)
MRTRTSLATILLIAGALALLLSLPALPAPASAAPLASLTETAEPTVVTATPQPTATQPPAATPEPTATAIAPTATAVPPEATAVPPEATATAAPEGESRHADPAVSVSVSPGEAHVGDSVAFIVTVTNRGDGDARDVVVEDNLPGFLELLSAGATRGDVQTTPRGVRLFLGRVSPGDEVVMEIVARAITPAAPPDNVNLVTLTTPSGGDNPANNQSVAAVLVAGDAPAAAAPEAAAATPEAAAATPEAAAALVAEPAPAVAATPEAAVAAAPVSAAAPAAPAEPSSLPHTAGVEPWGVGPALLVGLALLGLGTRLTQRRRRK